MWTDFDDELVAEAITVEVEEVWAAGLACIYDNWALLEEQYGHEAVLSVLEQYEYFTATAADYAQYLEETS